MKDIDFKKLLKKLNELNAQELRIIINESKNILTKIERKELFENLKKK